MLAVINDGNSGEKVMLLYFAVTRVFDKKLVYRIARVLEAECPELSVSYIFSL